MSDSPFDTSPFGAARRVPAALASGPSVPGSSAGPPAGRWYRVVECGLDAGGDLRVQPREYLNRSVYDRSTTFRFLSAEAKKLSDSDAVGVTDEEGALVHLLAGKTGRFASADLKKLVIAKLVADGGREPEPKSEAPKKRTSRVPGAKRTSRKKDPAAATAKRTSKKRTSRRKKPKAAEVTSSPRSIWNA